jgi:hypothetical protein
MTVSPLQTRPSKVWTTPDHEQFAVLVLEMAAQRLSLEADGVLLGQKCPIFMPERASHAAWAGQFNQGNYLQLPKKELTGLR